MKSKILFSDSGSGLQIEIETKRLYLRSYEQKDFCFFVLLYSDKNLMRYFDYGKPLSKEETTILVQERGKKFTQSKKPFGLFSVFSKQDNTFIGQFDFLPMNEIGVAEFGCVLLRKYQNRGFCQEMCKSFIFDYVPKINQKNQFFAFEELPIKKIMGTVHPKNYPSIKNLKNLGMAFIGEKQRFNQPRLWYSYSVPKHQTIHDYRGIAKIVAKKHS